MGGSTGGGGRGVGGPGGSGGGGGVTRGHRRPPRLQHGAARSSELIRNKISRQAVECDSERGSLRFPNGAVEARCSRTRVRLGGPRVGTGTQNYLPSCILNGRAGY